MNAAIARRLSLGALLATAATGTAAAPAAAAPCRPMSDPPAWRSCLSTGHTRLEDGRVRLKRALPRLVIRYAECPADLPRRRVRIRTAGGRLLARASVPGQCRNGIARWKVTLRPEGADLRSGTVVTSNWSGIADRARAPRIKLL